MVLQELGGKLTAALQKMQSVTVISEEVLDKMLKDIAAALLEADVNVRVVGQLRKAIKTRAALEEEVAGANRRKLIQRAVVDELVNIVDPGVQPHEVKKGKPNVIMFVGLQGAGKTTTIAKFANYYQRKGFKCCMVCADTFRAGAYDQLKQNATKLRCPFYGSYTEADPVAIAAEGVAQFRKEKYEVIIVDTSGRHRQEAALFEEMQEIRVAIEPDNVVFVLDATQGQAVHEQATSFHEAIDIGSVVVTKLDGHAKGGGALSAVAATGAPILFLGSGEHFDDFEPFVARSFVSRLLGMGDMSTLVKQIKDTIGDDKNDEMMEKFSKGEFTLRDMYEQFENVMKLGPLSKVMAMIPGIPQMGGEGDEGGNRLKRFMYMMDSMTDDELDGRVDLNRAPSRVDRVARGSGTHPMEVQMLLRCHKQFEGVVTKMGKSGLMKGGDEQMVKQMQRNPNQVLQQLHKTMDPRMLQQMGGAQNLMNMMKQMSELEAKGGK
jgi:signal recognition particle subunit SRP54|mmetsp:Transcript_21746/g.56760  ORF Transcript_21746/g.56760 Transcript_21746/m.56760 type:complete len:492 (-) Transcript_21746:3-1478(-)